MQLIRVVFILSLRQGAIVTKIFIDNNDTTDQSAEIKAFKKAIQDKIAAQK